MFPMFIDKRHSQLGWWSPVQRGVIPLDGLRVTQSMKKSARKFRCTVNLAFNEVMSACATTHTQGNWIDDKFIAAYSELHRLGVAHSVEVWNHNDELVGGVYGVRINNFFAGESMFHLERDASKVALMFLVELMNLAGMTLLDTQWQTEHLESLGCIEIPRDEYLALLVDAVGQLT
jgi:leucyl/phenylalanyl-tRNA--protein transferase